MITQIAILLTGVIAIYLTQQPKEHLKKYACIFGLIGQPFWMYATYVSGQFGIFLLTFVYTYVWCVGLYNNWIKKDESENNGKVDILKDRSIELVPLDGDVVENLPKSMKDLTVEIMEETPKEDDFSLSDDQRNLLRELSGINEDIKNNKKKVFFDDEEVNERFLKMIKKMQEKIAYAFSYAYSSRMNQRLKDDIEKNYEQFMEQSKKEHEEYVKEMKKRKDEDISYLKKPDILVRINEDDDCYDELKDKKEFEPDFKNTYNPSNVPSSFC